MKENGFKQNKISLDDVDPLHLC